MALRPIRLRLLALLVLGLSTNACVASERREVAAARAAHRACVAERGADHPECAALAARLREAQARYESNARRAWGCDPRAEECPVER